MNIGKWFFLGIVGWGWTLCAMDLRQGTCVNLGKGICKTTSEILSEKNRSQDDFHLRDKPHFLLPELDECCEEVPYLHHEEESFADSFLHTLGLFDSAFWPNIVKKQLLMFSNVKIHFKGFNALNFSEEKPNNYIPPNTMGAVGPTQFIIHCNGAIRSFDKKTGIADGVLDLQPNTFFSALLADTSGTIDPRIRYDRTTDRWFLTTGTFQKENFPNKFLIAVSDSGIITTKTVWSFFQFQPSVIAPARADPLDYADYPTLGIDGSALYVGWNIFSKSQAGGSSNSDIAVINKAELLANNLAVTMFRDIAYPAPGLTTPQGADNFDLSVNDGFIMGASSQYINQLIIRRVLNPASKTPTLSKIIVVSVPTFYSPIFSPHLGNNAGPEGNLNPLDTRLCNVHVRKGQIYTSHNIGVDNRGVSVKEGVTRNACRWYQIDVSKSDQPQLIQTATLFQPSVINDTNQRFFFTPSLMTNGLNSVILGCSTAGAPYYADAVIAKHFENDPLNSIRIPIFLTNSKTAYNLGSANPRGRRWGDNSHTCVDPDDDLTIWTIQEYCSEINQWGCYVERILAGAPAAAIKVSPSKVKTNSTKTIKIKGTRPLGGGFYEPGPEYPKHLTVSIEDVQVNSVTVISPTELHVNITTGESKGFKKIKIKNPDGQKYKSLHTFEIL